MKEAMEWAKANSGITSENIENGVCAGQTGCEALEASACIDLDPTDHRGAMAT